MYSDVDVRHVPRAHVTCADSILIKAMLDHHTINLLFYNFMYFNFSLRASILVKMYSFHVF